MDFSKFNNYIEDLNSNQTNDRKITNLFYEWYSTFDSLINDYLKKPFKERLIFKGYVLIVTSIIPTITSSISKLPLISSYSNYNNYLPLWYIDFNKLGNVNVLINLSLNTISIIVTSYIGDSFIQTAAHSIIATMKVTEKYGFKNTFIGLVTNKYTVPFYIYQNSKLLTYQSFNDLESADKYLQNRIDKYLIIFLALSLLYYLNKN